MSSTLSITRAAVKFLFIAVLCLGPRHSYGFTFSSVSPQRSYDVSLQASTSGDRRSFLTNAAASGVSAVMLSLPSPAFAKGKPEPITAENVRDAFAAVRFELEDSEGVVTKLDALVRKQNYEELIDFTRETDLYFRKIKMGRARKLLTDKSLKDESVLMCNAVTFDLIGVNRSSRPGREDTEGALKYVEQMKIDIKKFLTLEDTIVIPVEE